ncbi:ABC transporter ATP-binding protein, partial [Streptomyces sp. NPDC051658]
AGDADALVPAHTLVTGLVTDGNPADLLAPHTVIEATVKGRQFHALVRPNGPLSNQWVAAEPSLEEVLLAYLRSPDAPSLFTPGARIEEGTRTA